MADARCWLKSDPKRDGFNKNPLFDTIIRTDYSSDLKDKIDAAYLRRSDRMIDGQVVIGYNPNIGGTVSMSPVEWAAQEKVKRDVADYKKRRYQELIDAWYGIIAETRNETAKVQGEDPDGPLVPMKPAHPFPERTITAPQHDFIAALYRPYNPVV